MKRHTTRKKNRKIKFDSFIRKEMIKQVIMAETLAWFVKPPDIYAFVEREAPHMMDFAGVVVWRECMDVRRSMIQKFRHLTHPAFVHSWDPVVTQMLVSRYDS